MRDPISLINAIGLGGFWVVQATTFGIFFSAIFHPLFLAHALYLIIEGTMFQRQASTFQVFVGGIDLAVLVAGYGVSIYVGWRALQKLRMQHWWFTLATMPLYWLLMSVAGWLALWQFAVAPFHWNKTKHGLSVFQKARSSKV